MKIAYTAIFCLLLSSAISGQQIEPLPLTEAQICKILNERVEGLAPEGKDIGIIVGLIKIDGIRIISYGSTGKESQQLDGNTIFEIASFTKVFTAILLAQMVQAGDVSLNDPVIKYLPRGTRIPERNGRFITLADLATHTSGLPFMPDPYTSSADIYKFIADFKLQRDPGTTWDYSNLGYWLLGQALAARKAMTFEEAIYTYVIEPLQLKNTAFELSPEMKTRLAVGHDAGLQPTAPTMSLPQYSQMQAAGGLYSSVNDLLILLSAAMGYEESSFTKLISSCLQTNRPTQQSNDIQGDRQGLGWNIITDKYDALIYRDGGGLGYTCDVVFDPKNRTGVVVLSNQAAPVGDIARHILRPQFPLEHPTSTPHKEISLDVLALKRLVGRYENSGEGVFNISFVTDHLLFEAPSEWGLPALRIRPETPTRFFASELPLRVKLEVNSNQTVTGILIDPPRGQKAIPAKKNNE